MGQWNETKPIEAGAEESSIIEENNLSKAITVAVDPDMGGKKQKQKCVKTHSARKVH